MLDSIDKMPRLFVPQTARMEKVFIFDVVSKIYVATDSSPVDIQMYEMQSTYSTFKSWPLQTNIYCLVVRYEMCCDMVDVMLDVSSIYGYPTENDSNGAVGESITVQGDSGGLGLGYVDINSVSFRGYPETELSQHTPVRDHQTHPVVTYSWF